MNNIYYTIMRFSGFFFFLALQKRSIHKTITNVLQQTFISNELEIRDKEKNHSNSNNITELLLLTLPGNITRKNIEGEDNRISESEQDQEQESFIRNIGQNMAKKQLLAFLEDPTKSDLQKIERIRENEHMFINDNENDTLLSSFFPGITKGKVTVGMGMGGFNDCYGFIDLVL